MVYNPLKNDVSKTIKIPLYYTGLKDKAMVSTENGLQKPYKLDRHYNITLEIKVAGGGYTWAVIQ